MKTKNCKLCGATFLDSTWQKPYLYCPNHRYKQYFRPIKNPNCLFCGKKLIHKNNNNKPFCGESCEFKYELNLFHTRNFNKKDIVLEVKE